MILTILPQAAYCIGSVSRNLLSVCRAGELLPTQKTASTSAAFINGAIHVTLQINPASYVWQRGLVQYGHLKLLGKEGSTVCKALATEAASYLQRYPKAIVNLGSM